MESLNSIMASSICMNEEGWVITNVGTNWEITLLYIFIYVQFVCKLIKSLQ